MHYSLIHKLALHTLALIGSNQTMSLFGTLLLLTSTNEEICTTQSSFLQGGAGWTHHFFQISVYPR